jgi:hypothetical protein
MASVFAKFIPEVYEHNYSGSLLVSRLVGGTPSDPRVAEGWIKSKLQDSDDLIQQAVAEIMVERGLERNEAAAELARRKHLNGFKRDGVGGPLYIEGRQLKACLKEAGGILISTHWKNRKWGATNKGTLGFMPEHIFVLEDKLYIKDANGKPVTEPTGIQQRFVSTFRGTGIQLEEHVDQAVINFTVGTDYEFSEKDWGFLWVTAQQNGLGASRSQGFGTFSAEVWEKTTAKPSRARKVA